MSYYRISQQQMGSNTATALAHTSEGRVSSTRMFGPVFSGPKAQIERAASRSQSYLVWKNSPIFFLETNGKRGDVRVAADQLYKPRDLPIV